MAATESAASTLPACSAAAIDPATKPAISSRSATPTAAAATRSMSQRARARENVRMAAVSQGLVDFANRFRQPAAPGIEVVETSRYRITLQPDYPVPGPNNVAWIRCSPDDDALAGAETFRQADAVWGGRMYAPTLERLGFQKVGWRRFYIDRE